MSPKRTKGRSWRRENPRKLLQRMIEANPGESRDRFLKEFRHDLRGEDGGRFLDHVIEYWFDHHFSELTGKRKRKAQP